MIQRLFKRIGILPYLLLGGGLVVIGLLGLEYLTSLWLFDPQLNPDLVRALPLDQVTPDQLLAAAFPEMIIALLGLFFVLVAGLALPLAYFINANFGNKEPRFFVVARQAILLGVWAAVCGWLQIHRSLGLVVAILVLGVALLFELLLQIRGRASSETRAFFFEQ